MIDAGSAPETQGSETPLCEFGSRVCGPPMVGGQQKAPGPEGQGAGEFSESEQGH